MPPKKQSIGRMTPAAKRMKANRKTASTETIQQREARLRNDRIRKSISRAAETAEERAARQRNDRIRISNSRAAKRLHIMQINRDLENVEATTSLGIVDTSVFNDSISIFNAAIDNIHQICRFCLGFNKIKPFCDITLNQISVEAIIFDCLSLKVDPEDPLPHNLCKTCITELIRYHSFRENCIRVTNTLRDAYYNRNSRIKKEITIQCNDSEYCDSTTDTLIIKEEEIENPTVCNDYILQDMFSDNFVIKNENIQEIPTVCASNNFGDANSGDLVIQNGEIEDASLTCSNGTDNDNLIVKNEEIAGAEIIATATDNLTIKNKEIGDVQIVCDDIALKDTNSDNLIKQEILHKCRLCQQPFIRKCNLRKHMLIHKKQIQHLCTICTESFVNRSSLNSHMLIHEGETPYKCNVCGKSFVTKSNLKIHKLIHLTERPYKCTVCTNSFNNKHSLERHILSHTEERPYKCSVCFESFIDESDIENHMKIHKDEILYKCNVCGKSFFYKSVFYESFLKSHMETHKAD